MHCCALRFWDVKMYLKNSTKGWNCHELGLLLYLSLSHSVVHTHTHTHMHTPTLSPTCLSSQSASALLCSDTCSHSHLIIPSNLQALCLRLSVGLLYVMYWMWSLTCRRLKSSYLVLSRLELLWVSGFLCVLLLPPVSPVPRGPSRLKSLGPDRLQFCVYARQTALFAHSLKTVLTKSFCIWILYTPHCDRNNSCNIILLKIIKCFLNGLCLIFSLCKKKLQLTITKCPLWCNTFCFRVQVLS